MRPDSRSRNRYRLRATAASLALAAASLGVGVAGADRSAAGATESVGAPAAAAPLAGPMPVDPRATPETVALYRNLKALEGTATLFGHQDALAYGHDWSAVDGRSDVKDVVGAYPSVLGFDVGRLETGSAANIDGVRFDDMRRWIRQGYELG
mgnify:FL=1